MQLQKFGAHPLARQPRQAVALARWPRARPCAIERRRRRSGRRSGRSAGCADSPRGCAARASPMKRTRRAARSASPPSVIVDPSVGAERQRVDGEVAPARVGGEIAAERHLGVAAVGLDVLAQRRRPRSAGRRRSTVTVPWARPVGTTLNPAARGAAHHLVGERGRREIEIAAPLAEREVAHRAADQPRLLAVAVQRCERPGERPLASAGPRSASRPSRRPAGQRVRSFDPPRHEHAVLDHAPAHRRPWPRGAVRLTDDEAKDRRRRGRSASGSDTRTPRPVLDLERIAGAQTRDRSR